MYLLKVGNPVDNIEDNEEGRETLQEELVNSENTRILDFSFQWPLITSRNPPQVAQVS